MDSLSEEQIKQLEDELRRANDLLTEKENQIIYEEKECTLLEEKIQKINQIKILMNSSISEMSACINSMEDWYGKQDVKERTELENLIIKIEKEIKTVSESLNDTVESIVQSQSLATKTIPRMNSRNFYEPGSF